MAGGEYEWSWRVAWLGLALWVPCSGTLAFEVRTRTLDVRIELRDAAPHLDIEERIQLATAHAGLEFELGAGLQLQDASTPAGPAGFEVSGALADGGTRYQVATRAVPAREFRLRYAGSLRLPRDPLGNYFDHDGLWLSAATAWYARYPFQRLGRDLVRTSRTTLRVTAPAEWQCLSQGAGRDLGGGAVEWREPSPQVGVQLVCGPYRRYQRRLPDGIQAEAWLLSPDRALADAYLDTTAEVLPRYSAVLGNYPYAKFALVESRAPVGYGMPSFTMIGSRVIRLPFIRDTSFVHEIVHNWLGNSVYADMRFGNWTEGLTTYLADHAQAEHVGGSPTSRFEAVKFRLKALYAISVEASRGEAYPITRFRGRASRLDVSIGYNRVMMLFHMLRLQMGDTAFRAALLDLGRDTRFRHVDFLGIRDIFQKHSTASLAGFFSQWLTRADLPRLGVEGLRAERGRIRGVLRQAQPGEPFARQVPVVLRQPDGSQRRVLVALSERETALDIAFEGAPPRVDVDPFADVLRELPPTERPPLLMELLGTDARALLHPAAPASRRRAYRELARQLGLDTARATSDDGRPAPTWLLGAGFGSRAALDARALDVGLAGDALRGASCFVAATHTAPSPRAWVVCDPDSTAGLARRLRHYGSRGLLVVRPESRRPQAYDWARPPLATLHEAGVGSAPIPSQAPLIGR